MIPTRVDQILNILNGRLIAGAGDAVFNAVSIDSRTIRPQQAFFAIRGQNFDGHDYAAAAIEKGASCVIIDHEVKLPPDTSAAVIQVDNTIVALGCLAAWYRGQISAKVIAITGSVGKTTTRQMLYTILSGSYRCRQAPKSFNNNIGVPLTILSAEADDEILLLELGSNAPGEIADLTNLSKPDIAVITFIGPAHLEGFRTLDNVLKEKASIAEGLKSGGILYINGDQPELVRYIKQNYDVNTIAFGTTDTCDVIGAGLQTSGTEGTIMIDGQQVTLPMPGKANLLNLLTVWSICRDLNLSLSDFIIRTKTLQPVPMRMQIVNIGPLIVINDCYNANPSSMMNAIETLSNLKSEKPRRRVFIAGCMGELGEQSETLHRELGQKAAARGVQLLLVTGPFADAVLSGAKQAADPLMQMESYNNTNQLCDNLHKWIQPDDIILVKGSRVAGLERAVAKLNELYANDPPAAKRQV